MRTMIIVIAMKLLDHFQIPAPTNNFIILLFIFGCCMAVMQDVGEIKSRWKGQS